MIIPNDDDIACWCMRCKKFVAAGQPSETLALALKAHEEWHEQKMRDRPPDPNRN